MLSEAGLDAVHDLCREPVAVLADHLCGRLIRQPGRLGMAVAVRDGIQKGSGKHVARPIGVECFHRGCRYDGLLRPFEHHATLRATRQADGARQLAELLADHLQVLRATPDLGFFFVAEQIVQALANDGVQTRAAKVDHADIAQGRGQGDTGIFGDMELIGRLNKLDLACLPIGDNYTMGPDDAVEAVRMLKPARVVPMHYNTFDLIRQDPEAFRKRLGHLSDCTILKPGESVAL